MNEDSLASSVMHAAIARVLNDYYAATITEPPDLKQRTWQQVAPWLTFAREGLASPHAQVMQDAIAWPDAQAPQQPTSRRLNATIVRGIAVLITLVLIALLVSTVLPTFSP